MSAPPSRHVAIRTATARKPRLFERPRNAAGELQAVRDYFGSHAFGPEQMRDYLPADIIRQYQEVATRSGALSSELADRIAQGALEWAHDMGVTHFCHWFQPMTGATAEKHDAFIAFDGSRPIAQFTGAQLIQSEPDASSFPSGGMRTTFEARGYTAWDASSPLFVIERDNGSTLCIPSAFISFHGDALDKKTPLLRSMEALDKEAVRLLHNLGDTDVGRVTATAGPEQEYFLVDKAYVSLRPDLVLAGRTVLGAPAPKGQALDDHYFGAIPARVLAFMQEVETELYRLGVPAKTRHNEVAPSQFELAVLYSEANLAADHNQLVMETLKKVSARHDLAVLLHEKPFAGVNGSGKHLNWSMATDTGVNLLDPGKDPANSTRFLAVLGAVVLGVYRHSALLRSAIATHGNDFRLGANEAPPAIISVFLGQTLDGVCNELTSGTDSTGHLEKSTIDMGIARLPGIARDNTDRNRTSPFAFTGNKFEFRALGSSQSISFPLTCVNLAVADGLAALSELIEAGDGSPAAVTKAIKQVMTESAPVRFEGNNYSEEWVAEAERRGLPHLRRAADALGVLAEDGTRDLFERHGVLTAPELDSRFHIYLEQYLTAVDIEFDVMRDLVDQQVMPAATAERAARAADVAATRAALGEVDEADLADLRELNALVGQLRQRRQELEQAVDGAPTDDHLARARAYANDVMPALESIRTVADALESRVADHRWPLPRYREMLFQN